MITVLAKNDEVIVMTKRLNKLLLLGIIAMALTVTAIPNTAFASEVIDGDYSVEEGAPAVEQSEEEILLLQEKERALEAYIESQNEVQPRASATWHYLGGSKTEFPNNVQINGYYCGPATVQNVIEYHKGVHYSQYTLASALGTGESGTTMPYIDDVLRDYTGKNYVYADIESESTWKRRIANNINDTNMAVVIDIYTMSSSSWPYETDGHYISIHGCYDATTTTCSKVMISDSKPDYNKRWSTSASAAYDANSAHSRQAMIW